MGVDIDLGQLSDDVLSLKLYDELDEESLYRSKIDLVQLESLESDVVVLIELKRTIMDRSDVRLGTSRGRKRHLTSCCWYEISCMNWLS